RACSGRTGCGSCLTEKEHLLHWLHRLKRPYLPAESLNELEDHDLDTLVADLGSNSNTKASSGTDNQTAKSAVTQSVTALPPPSNNAESSRELNLHKPQTKADKIQLALEKLKEAKVRKLIVKVLMSDGSAKTLMVDERQTVREVLDKLFEKTHCDCSIDWSLGFEDHEYLVEPLSAWTRDSENRIYFVSRPQKYRIFKDPQSSSDLACFVHFEKVNIYTTTNYKQKYRAPTNFCFILKHPCIQKESHYIKFLCCDDQHTLLLWTNSIRTAKYGTVLYKNYQAAMKIASSAQTLHLAAYKDKYSADDYPHEPPPDFIPPPPPGHTQV
ncbi:Amyloid beta A4 precursor protein-binding family B member 1-interacting protein, partial [Nibea albiflora]